MRACRIDTNQNEIVEALRNAGASVLITSQLKNCFDILVGYNGVNHIMEIKDGSLSDSKRKLTNGEQKFKYGWKGGKYNVVTNVEEALNLIK
jgi:triacylglycerol esterase/lipase EstA (alpha/beta hydrolase family)